MVNVGLKSPAQILIDAEVIFWDFDGVIKDSASVKTQAYVDMVAEFGVNAQKRVLLDYKLAGGMSRFELIPRFYNDLLKIELTDAQLAKKFDLYSKMVVESVILSAYIKGVESYLDINFNRQRFIIVTNTPKTEIDMILKKLGIDRYFESVFGAPDLKEDVVKNTLERCDVSADNCVFVGDSSGDFKAAQVNNVPFIYRGSEDQDLYEYSLVDFLDLNVSG
jgi:phosphoglycolate phosphatase-like HAD superfamily hydrolase